MDRSDLARSADPQAFVPYLRDNPPPLPTGAREHGPVQTVRTESYRGHDIVVRTTYKIEVDGRPVMGHLGVGNDGQAHCHALPNYSFDSALDLLRQLIDSFPQRFAGADHHSQGGE